MSGIKLMIVDSHPVIREGLVAMLSSYQDIDVIGTCGSAAEALEFINSSVPDVILMEVKLGKISGIEATREILARAAGSKVIMLTVYENPESIRLSIQAGAAGYILKSISKELLVDSIRRVYKGETVIDPSLLNQFFSDYARLVLSFRSFALPDKDGLTPRESEVLKYLALGLTNKEISAQTHLALDTVKTHLRNIYRKLGVKSRSQAISKITGKKYPLRNIV